MNQNSSFDSDAVGVPKSNESLIQAAHRLLANDEILAAVLGVTLDDAETSGDLLGAVLCGSIKDRETRSVLQPLVRSVFSADKQALDLALSDVKATATKDLDPGGEITTLFFSRGLHALLAHRVAHSLWIAGNQKVALAVKNVFGHILSTDIHPAAHFGSGIWLDHGIGFVVGQTAIVEDDVCIWHGVTLGASLKDMGGSRRHPKLCKGVTVGADSVILGGVTVGEEGVIAAGSVVLRDVDPFTTVAGVPAKLKPRNEQSFSRLHG